MLQNAGADGIDKDQLNEMVYSLQMYDEELNITKENIQGLQEVAGASSGSMQKKKEKLGRSGTNFQQVSTEASNVIDRLQMLKGAIAQDSQEFQLFTEIENQLKAGLAGDAVNFERLAENLSQGSVSSARFKEALDSLLSTLKRTNVTEEDFQRILKENIGTLRQATGEVVGYTEASKMGLGQFKQQAHSLGLQKVSNEIIGLAQGFGQLAFAVQSVGHLQNI